MEMMMMMVLLVSAAAQLVSPAPRKQNLNLNHIINLVAEIRKNITQEFFVEDVTALADNGCKNDFLCKVESILQSHGKEETLVRNLGTYIQSLNVNCTKELEKVPKSEVSKPITNLLQQLDRCSKWLNFNAQSSSSN